MQQRKIIIPVNWISPTSEKGPLMNMVLRAIVLSSAFVSAVLADLPAGYAGLPFRDTIQTIEGRIRMYRFDKGAKNVTWYDYEATNPWYCKIRATDAPGVGMQNMGAGGDKWNAGFVPPDSVRFTEAPSLTVKLVTSPPDCYLANTNTKDWIKFTVNVKKAGTYKINALTAANGTTTPFVRLSFLNGADSIATPVIKFPLTNYFHDWVYTAKVATIDLKEGLQVMRLDITGNGPMNINYFDFIYDGATPVSAHANISNAITSKLQNGTWNFSIPSTYTGIVNAELRDVHGRIVTNSIVSAKKNSLSVTDLHSGVYIATIKTELGSSSQTLMYTSK